MDAVLAQGSALVAEAYGDVGPGAR
jgi:hypothetical protein